LKTDVKTFGTAFLIGSLVVFGYVAIGVALDFRAKPQIAVASEEQTEPAFAAPSTRDIPAMGMIELNLNGGAIFVCALKENLDGSHVVDLFPDGSKPLLPAGRYVFMVMWPTGSEVRGALTVAPGKVLAVELTDPATEAEKK
jgi:hypothetical protein